LLRYLLRHLLGYLLRYLLRNLLRRVLRSILRRMRRRIWRHGCNGWRVRVRTQSGILVDVVVDVHYGYWCVAGGAGAVQAMLAPLESVWIQVHVVAVAVHVVGLRTPWRRVVVIVTQITHGREVSDHRTGHADKRVRRQEYRVCGIVCRGYVFFLIGGKEEESLEGRKTRDG
jgi:hypothetical protein